MSMDLKSTNKTRNVFDDHEDERIRQLVGKHGSDNWKQVADEMPGRTARQCRERWMSYLDPHIHNGPWTPEEDQLLRHKFETCGPRWRELEVFFPNRSDINLKNRWRKLKKREISHQVPQYSYDEKFAIFDRIFYRLLLEDSAELEKNHEPCRFTINMFW
jgi:hypothetical protein